MPRRRLIPYRNYNSDTATIAMPTGYENSAMKMSFSLSSLQPSSASLEGPDHARLRSERQYSSLTKKPRKSHEQDAWRRSWSSRDEGVSSDEFWAALQPNYNYLMDSQLMDSCSEELSVATPTCLTDASFLHELNQIKTQFTELYAWLSSVQDGVYGKEECLTDRRLRVSHMEEMHRNSHLRETFNAKSADLLVKSPRMNDEVSWRVSHLNCKWEMLEQALTAPPDTDQGQVDASTGDVEHEVRCLRKWLTEMETRLQPLDFRTTDLWTQVELDEKAREHMVLQRDVESHGKIVCSVVKLCERVAARTNPKSTRRGGRGTSSSSGGGGGRQDALGVARSLESRWHHLYLRSLEWSCMIEALADKLRNNSPSLASTDSDEGPASKYPRLSQSLDQASHSSDAERRDASSSDDDVDVMDAEPTPAVEMVAPTTMLPMAGDAKGKKRRGGEREMRVDVEGIMRKADGAVFNKTTRDAPNYASYYFRHQDTDSEQDACRKTGIIVERRQEKPLEESSEEEWTYTNGKQDASSSSSENTASSMRRKKKVATRLDFSADSMDENEINLLVNGENQKSETSWQTQLLVTLVEEIVVPKPRVFKPLDFDVPLLDAKTARVNEWLKLNADVEKPVDSCDASGEYTTGDDEKESEEEEEEGAARMLGCARSCSSDAILEDASQDDTTSPLRTPNHVVMRAKRRPTCDRPWSVSGVPQLEPSESLSHFSISESALHQIVTPTSPGHRNTMNTSTSTIDGGCGAQGGSHQGRATRTMNTSTSTIEAGTPGNGDGGSRTGSLRRRKLRPKKRSMGRKSESGSDGLTVSTGSDTPQVAVDAQEGLRQSKLRTGAPDTMLRESSSEEEDRVRRPSFKLGPDVGAVSFLTEPRIVLEENHSSLSEQAWDSYQEKYMSEPYSEEPADSETARRLLEFGDDYSKYIGSQSDCPSSLCSSNQMVTPPRRRKPVGVVYPSYAMDSDSDVEEIRHVIAQSRSQLNISESVFNNQLLTASAVIQLDKEFAELIATCRENIKALNMLLHNVDHVDGQGLISARDCREMRGLVERWEMLQANSEDLRRVRGLQREMVDLKEELEKLASRVEGMEVNLQDREQLEARIAQTKTELASLKERKGKLLDVNVAVHRFQTDTGFPTPVLKDNVADLYRIWDETFASVSQRLTSLQQVASTWQQFDAHLGELQVALRGDLRTLRMLEAALRGGEDVATSVMDVARVLSEKQDRYHHAISTSPSVHESTTTTDSGMTSTMTQLGEGGSLSDSGISDEGSEQELSERERRLEALRRLARHLEGVLAPGSAVLDNMAKRIAATENELRSLQRTCRDLIVRTAVCAAPDLALAPAAAAVKVLPRSRKTSTSRRHMLGVAVGSPDDDSDPDKRRSWLWRVIRAALPFQMALVALFCVACLLEPHCCDAMNNLSLSLTPQLRYLGGPPPV